VGITPKRARLLKKLDQTRGRGAIPNPEPKERKSKKTLNVTGMRGEGVVRVLKIKNTKEKKSERLFNANEFWSQKEKKTPYALETSQTRKSEEGGLKH